MRPIPIEGDMPKHDDAPDLPPDLEDKDYYDIAHCHDGFKIGGWPSLIQSEVFWAPWNRHPANPTYVFQIDSNEKAGWSWGHNGVGYIGRGTAPGYQDDWFLSWQSL